MSLRTLYFNPLHLSSKSDKLSLFLKSEAEVKLSSEKLRKLTDVHCIEALTSGEVWVSRGNSCRLDLSFTLDGEPFNTDHDHIVQSLGHHIGASKIWEQLGLSTITHTQEFPRKETAISIDLRYLQPSPSLPLLPRPWSISSSEFRVPESVPCAEVQRLHVKFNFSTEELPRSILKKTEVSRSSPNFEPALAKNDSKRSITIARVDQSLTGLLMNCSQGLATAIDAFLPLANSTRISGILPASTTSGSTTGRKVTTVRHPKEAIDVLLGWVAAHEASQKPNPQERRVLAQRTGLETKQIQTWFNNRMKRTKRKDTATDAMLSLTANTPQSLKVHGDDEMLLMSEDESVATLPSESSTALKPLGYSSISRRLSNPEIITVAPYKLDLIASHNLFGTAMRMLITSLRDKQKQTRGIQIHNASTKTSLSNLCPVMFSPGYKKSIASNAKYISRITQSMSYFALNAQSPSLREKFTAIASQPTSPLATDAMDSEISGKAGSEECLAAVVQARLWSMMQRSLYNSSAARRAIRTSPITELTTAEDDDGYDNLLDGIEEEDAQDNSAHKDDFEWIISDNDPGETSEFDCLLSDDGSDYSCDEFDDLLDYDGEDDILLGEEDSEIKSRMDMRCFGNQESCRADNVEGIAEDDDVLLLMEESHDILLLEEPTIDAGPLFIEDMLI